MDYSRPGAPGRFSDIAEFIEKNPAWPRQKALCRHAEEALAGEPDDVAVDWFKRFPPVSAVGKVRSAEILLNSGNSDTGLSALRAAWIDGDFGPLDERNFLARHSASILAEDNEKRLAGFCGTRRTRPPAACSLWYQPIGATWAKRVWRWPVCASNAEVMAARVPAKLRADPGLIYQELRWRTRRRWSVPRCRFCCPTGGPGPAGGVVGRAANYCPAGFRDRQCHTGLPHRRATRIDRG